jgi:alpha-tubulin suppressor-like RCC1 family protein
VEDLRNSVGRVFCGSTHTFVVSADRNIVWVFGLGDSGKFGVGEPNPLYFYPKCVDALSGRRVRKLALAPTATLALLDDGRVLAFGSGICLGSGSRQSVWVVPKFILKGLHVVDVSAGDSHCLAVTDDSTVS